MVIVSRANLFAPDPTKKNKKTFKRRRSAQAGVSGRIQPGWRFVYGVEGAKMNGIVNAEYTTDNDSLALTTLFPTAEEKQWMCSLVDTTTTLTLWMAIVPPPKNSADASNVVFVDVPCLKHPQGTLTVVYKKNGKGASEGENVFIANLLYYPGPSSSEILAATMEAELLKDVEPTAKRPLKRAKKQ